MNLIQADVLDWVKQNKTPKYHAALSDPPYYLGSITKRFGADNAAPAQYGKDGAFQRQSKGFMGKTWDGFESVWHFQAWITEWASGLLDSMYPGALGLFFGGTRTYHRLACGIEDAGWEIIDQIQYLYGSGFPKSHNVEDHGTALKPAFEPVIVARAPRGKHTFAQLYAEFGTGLFNIDGGRIFTTDDTSGIASMTALGQGSGWNKHNNREVMAGGHELGRWPANIILDDVAGAALDMMSGDVACDEVIGASRFFYTAKAASWEREAGLDDRCTHPTLKPIDLTTYLAKLILPPAHVGERRLLVPFAGVGSEMIGGHFAGWESVDGIEREGEYVEQGQARLNWWSQWSDYEQAKSAYKGQQREKGLKQVGQLSMFDEV